MTQNHAAVTISFFHFVVTCAATRAFPVTWSLFVCGCQCLWVWVGGWVDLCVSVAVSVSVAVAVAVGVI